MKYLKYFTNESDYQTFKDSEEYITPNVSYVEEINGVKFNPNVTSVSLIEFTVEGTPYQAEEGMTWQEFVDSNYNDGHVTINKSYVKYDGATIDNGGSFALASDVIVNGGTYNRAPM